MTKITKEFIERIYKRDRSACNSLYDLYAKKCFGICLRYARNRSDAQDMLQEGFLEVFKNIRTFKHEGSFEGWVKRIVFHQVVNFIRRHYKFGHYDELEDNALVQSPIDHFSEDAIMNVISSLPEKYKITFNLFAVDQLSHKEIADLLSIKEATSRSQFMRARHMIQEKLKQIENFDNKTIKA